MSMLDLNLSILHKEARHVSIEKCSEGSGTSSSSVVNSGDDTSSSPAVAFDFGIMKSSSAAEFVTQQLFPVTSSSSSPKPETVKAGSWIDLSFSGGGHVAQSQVAVVVPKAAVKKSRRGPRSRSSQYRGVTFYRRTGRWESHIWDCGKQVYLGGFDTAHSAARAYDRAAIKFRGVEADINFTLSDYEEDMIQTKNLSKEEFIHILRRQSTGFSRGSSKYRGVTLHKCGRWEARMGQFLGKKAYDKAAIKCNGREAVTNFEASTYEGEVTSEVVGGYNQDLDLKLGMSTPSSGHLQKDNEGFGHHLQLRPFSLHDSRRSKTDHTASSSVANLTLEGQPMAVEHPSSWTAAYSNFFQGYKDRAAEKRAEGTSMLASPNWVWPRQGGHVSGTSTAFATAASSGFSASVHSTKQPNSMPPFNLCFPSSTPMGTTNPHYFYQMKPSQQAP